MSEGRTRGGPTTVLQRRVWLAAASVSSGGLLKALKQQDKVSDYSGARAEEEMSCCQLLWLVCPSLPNYLWS